MSTPRDPKRIDRLAELLREAWHLQPDFRLTQLVMVVSDKPENAGALWHLEDDTIEQKLRAFIAGMRSKRQHIVAVSSHDDGNAALLAAGASSVCSKMQFQRIQQVIAELERS